MGHQLHFDTEENTLASPPTLTGGGEQGGTSEIPFPPRILHPAVSSVCYLTGAAAGGGPTVVFDQRVGEGAAERAFVS